MSDADILIKLIRCSKLSILPEVFSEVVIPDAVEREISRILGRSGNGALGEAKDQGWLMSIDTTAPGSILDAEACRSIDIFVQSFRFNLHKGELAAASLGNELGIPWLLSDDRGARRIIEDITEH